MVTKTIFLDTQTNIINYAGQSAVTLYFTQNEVKEIALILALLKENLVDNIILVFPKLKINLNITSSNFSSCKEFDQNKGYFKGEISVNALGYWLSFMLKYYRDNIGEADHIDLDFELNAQREITLVIKLDYYTIWSEEETSKRLGLK